MEIWDLYNELGEKLNITKKRGEQLEENEFHLVVNVWIVNDKKELLISQRIATKPHGLMWETTGGSVTAGEGSLLGAVREAQEELGVELKKEEGIFIGKTLRYFPNCNDILETWLFKLNNTPKVLIQEEEVNDYKWASIDEVKELNQKGLFHTTFMLEEIIELIEKDKTM